MNPPPARRRWLPRVALVLGGALGGLVLAEAVGRVDGLVRGNDLVSMAPMSYPQDIYVQDGAMTYPNPRFSGTIQSFGYSVKPRFSRWGTRGADPTPGGPTWLAVGDSFTIALQVEEDQTFAAQLGTALPAQVINAGVDGYSTWKEAIRAVQLGRHFPPTGVVAAFFTGNDFADNRTAPTQTLDATGLGPGEPGAPDYPIPKAAFGRHAPAWQRFLRDHSVLAAHHHAWETSRRMRRPADPEARRFRDELTIFTTGGAARRAADLPSTQAALTSLRDACTRLNARCVVAVIPPAFVMDDASARRTFESVGLAAEPDLDSAQAAAVGAAQAAELEVCDLMPPLRAAHTEGARPYLPFDGHLSVEGHRRVGAALTACIGR